MEKEKVQEVILGNMSINKQELIKQAKNAYYNSDTPIMSDAEYDLLVKQVGYESVGSPVLKELKKIKIEGKPMLSLAKCHSAEEIIDFAQGQDLVASIKCDGLSVRIIYEDGIIVSANTRGDGEIGQDITEHIKQFKNVPLIINKKERLVVDGEAVILQKDFDEINADGEFKNPRNLAAGTLASLDTSLSKKRKMSFIAWDVIEGGGDYYFNNLADLTALGFFVVPSNIRKEILDELKYYNDINEYMLNRAKKEGIPCDGVVWKFNDINYNTERTAHHFKNAIAWKPTIEKYEARLNTIKWQVGRSGVLTPIACFDPIEIEGTIVERASLHNYSVMRETLGPCAYIGEPLQVYKANQIIPQILPVDDKWRYDYGYVVSHCGVSANDEPEFCPCCEKPVYRRVSDSGVENYYCENPQCEGKLVERLEHFCSRKGLDIRGLSEQTLEKLVDWKWVKSIKDLYNLSSRQREWKNKLGFGEKSVDNILIAIENSKHTTLEKFISAIGIPLIGERVSKILAEKCENWETFRNLIKKDSFSFEEWDGFGYEMNRELKHFNYDEADELAKMFTFTVVEKAGNDVLKGKTFVITGKLSRKRDDIIKDVENAGGKVVSSVSGKTNYLVCNKPEDTTKYHKAEQLGIPIITENQLMNMMN